MTLIEIMIVLAILGMVMGFLGPKVFAYFKEARVKVAKLMVKDYMNAYTQWSVTAEESCPGSLEELRKYRNKKDDKDPWGSTFLMKCGQGGADGAEFVVVSPGPDKKEGTQDDVKSED